MIGHRLSHYDIREHLGRGGMGEVFLAHDRALARPAAIKVLPDSFDPEIRDRLLREAETSRRLQHPGIATFFETGEEDGVAFIAMEYVRGETLRARLRRGAMPRADAIAVASTLLEAVGHAHAAGIVHRDIKPENIMVMPADDRSADIAGGAAQPAAAKLLDFGIAYRGPLLDRESAATLATLSARLTEVGTIVGTIGYMAPEQLRGEAADPRADLFALGAVLFEMLTGVPAFPGATPVARITATLSGSLGPMPGVGDDMRAVVARSLELDPDRRYQSSAEFLRALRSLGGSPVPPSTAFPETLAVLPFETRSADSTDSWIGVGIAESLVADLGRFRRIGVVPQPKVQRAAAEGDAEDPAALGARLGCRWVLSGSCQRMGPALRVVMRLTHVPTQEVAAAEKLDGRLDDIFAMQDALGRRAADALGLDERAQEHARTAPVLGAYECYTRGRQLWIRLTKGGFDQAEDLFLEAIRQEPEYADALSGLAALHDMRFPYTTDRTELERARDFARRAVTLAPTHAEAHVWLGYALWRLAEGEDPLPLYQRAETLDPGSHYPSYFCGCLLASRGEHAAAIPFFQRAVSLGPAFGFAWIGLANAHTEIGQFDEAVWSYERGIDLERSGFHATAGAAGYLGECLRRQGKKDEGRAQCLAGLDAVERTDHMYRDTLRAVCLNALGRVALDQNDREAAAAAFRQCELHLEGRPRSLGAGWLFCQALAGLAAAGGGDAMLRRALDLFEKRRPFDWSWLWLCSEEATIADLARAQRGPGPTT